MSGDLDVINDEWVQPRKRNPLVIVGAVATAGVLAGGLIAFKQGKAGLSQQMMRARVMFQGATVALMVGSSGYYALADKKAVDLKGELQ